MKAQDLGHVVFYVKDLEQSLAFYRDLLGFQEVGRIFNGAAAALTSGRTHHELLLIQVGDEPGPLSGRRRGLYHIGIKVGDSLGELREAKKDLEQSGVTIDGMSDHTVSQSLYLQDPDGNEVERYVDADESVWKNNPPPWWRRLNRCICNLTRRTVHGEAPHCSQVACLVHVQADQASAVLR